MYVYQRHVRSQRCEHCTFIRACTFIFSWRLAPMYVYLCMYVYSGLESRHSHIYTCILNVHIICQSHEGSRSVFLLLKWEPQDVSKRVCVFFYLFLFMGNGWENAIFTLRWPKKGLFLKNHYSLLVVVTVTLKYALSRFLRVFQGVLFG